MKLETFFEKFDQFAVAPGAVAKMRELVLYLAVTGKLVPQDLNDEPTALMLKKIEKEKKQLSDSGKLKADKKAWLNSSPIPPNNIPDSWSWVRLQDVFEISRGGSPRPAGDPRFFGGSIPWITVGEVTKDSNKYLTHTTTGLTAEGAERSRFINPGDLLLTNSGATLGVPKISRIRGCMNDGVAVLRLFHPFDFNEFAYIYLTQQTAAFRNVNQGMGQPNLNTPIIAGWFFPLPPLAEQKRIVAKVDELMALCDRLEAEHQEREEQASKLARASLARFAESPTPENLEYLFHKSYTITPADLRKSILTLAVHGLLLPHDAESANWETKKLKELTTKIGSGSTPSGGKESYQENGVPLIRSMNVHFGGFVRQGLAFLNDEQAEKLKNVTVKADDVLLNITGASIGRVTTAPKEMEGARVNQHVCILRPTTEIIPPFLELFLASPVVQNLINNVQVGATREALTKSMIEQFDIPVPSLAEQRRIVAKVEQLMALVDELEQQLAASRATAANLLSALVAELTGTPSNRKVSVPAATTTGRRGRPAKS